MKRAWEYCYELTQNAKKPKNDSAIERWAERLASAPDHNYEKARKHFHSNVTGSGAPESVLVGGIASVGSMGYDVSKAEALIEPAYKAYKEENAPDLVRIRAQIMFELENAPKIPDHPYWNYKQYNSFSEYESDVDFPADAGYDIASDDFEERTYAGWVTQVIGSVLGTAIEGYTTDMLYDVFGEITSYVNPPQTYNDDITYEIAFLEAFKEYGYDVTADILATYWVGFVPSGWSAEEAALANIMQGIRPPKSAVIGNPWREWIGAQMKGAICGMVAPGNYREAARLAWIDGSVAHVNNGIIGEIFNALLVSGAYIEPDVATLLKKVLGMIPKESEYYSVVNFAYQQCLKNSEWLPAWRACEEKFKEYNWIHAYPNAAAEVVALYFAGDDFNKCMNIIAMCGQDVDCNAAQIATIYGVMFGLSDIDSHWIDPIGDDIKTYVRTYEDLNLRDLAKATVEAVRNAV